jgi:NitT/TauT family transport system ATP-binding protein
MAADATGAGVTATRVTPERSRERSSGPRGGRVEFRDVRKEFRLAGGKLHVALSEVTLTVEPGEVVAIVGQTGAGKSTALHLLLGLSPPTSGTVRVDGRDPHAEAERFRGRIGIIFQNDRLMPWRTALGNALLGLEILDVSQAEREARAMRWLTRLGLADFAHAWPYQLSGGMRQRVAICRTFALDPDLLVADEAFSHLDELTARELRQELSTLVRETGTTTVFVTHSVDEAMALADRILVFASPGRVVESLGVPADLDERGRLELRERVIGALMSARAV